MTDTKHILHEKFDFLMASDMAIKCGKYWGKSCTLMEGHDGINVVFYIIILSDTFSGSR